MNITVLTEGKSEKYIYKSWISLVNPLLTFVESIDNLSNDNFVVISAFGYPSYLQLIHEVIDDVNRYGNIDRLVICVDSEDMSLIDKQNEIRNHVSTKQCSAKVFVVIQHFCIETWALGNVQICPINPRREPLRTYKAFFDVRTSDPELLPSYAPLQLNRAKFAALYLDTLLRAGNPPRTYRKDNPEPLPRPTYFQQVKLRHQTTNHIGSFGNFLSAFV